MVGYFLKVARGVNMQLVKVIVLITVLSLIVVGQSVRDEALESYRNGEFERTISILQELSQDSPADYLSLVYLGAAYVKIGKTEQAIETFKQLNKASRSTNPLNYDSKLSILNAPQAPCTGFSLGGTSAKVAVELGSNGKIGFAVPFLFTDRDFAKLAGTTAKGVRFKPAIFNAKPVPVVLVMEYNC